MGILRRIFVEPFIRIPTQYELVAQTVFTCGEHDGERNNIYCPKCGKKLEEKNVFTKQPTWYEELTGNENLFQYFEDDTMYLFDNLNGDIGVFTEENIISVITPESMQKMINDFKEFHADDIKILEKKLGIEIKVEFGFLYEVS